MKISALFANKRTRVIVIVAAVVLVLAILTPILLYAGGYIMPFDADGTPSARLLNRIEGDYGRRIVGWWYMPLFSDDIQFTEYYGVYNGAIVIDYTYSGWIDIPDVHNHRRIGGVFFYDYGSGLPSVWKNGKTAALSDAYENGWLTVEDLEDIAKTHNPPSIDPDWWD